MEYVYTYNDVYDPRYLRFGPTQDVQRRSIMQEKVHVFVRTKPWSDVFQAVCNPRMRNHLDQLYTLGVPLDAIDAGRKRCEKCMDAVP